MAALTSSKTRRITRADAVSQVRYPVAASTTIYKGSALGWSSGYIRKLVAGDVFAGFAMEEVDNSAGSAADKLVTVVTRGVLYGESVTGASGQTNLVAPNNDVFASSDNDWTLTITSNSKFGHIIAYDPVAGNFDIYFEAAGFRSLT